MILADTGPLYALAMKRDALHARAHRELKQLHDQGLTLLVSMTILLETHKLLLRREHPAFAAAYGASLMMGSELINPTIDDYLQAQHLLERYSAQSVTLYDASLYTLSTRLDIPIWTFDIDFDVLRANVWRA